MTKLSSGRGAACTILTVAVLVGTAVTPARAEAAGQGDYLVAVSGDADDFRTTVAAAGGTVEDVFGNLDVLAVTLPSSAAAALDARAGVTVEPAFQAGISAEASYGLDRIDQRSLPLSQSYARPSTGMGEGVDVYVMDTGIRADHQQFGGRVLPGFTAIDDGYGTSDCHGHGTHVAGTIGGQTVGVAPRVHLIPVRVLNCEGTTTTGYEFMDGLDWIIQNHQAGQPAVLNMSFGGSASSIVDDAVADVQADGVTVVAAAGNEDADACGVSPARAPAALAVAASTIYDARASYSNFGSCVDLFAPGGDGSALIRSAGIAGPTQLVDMAGTSMASPHVAGAAARYLSSSPAAAPSSVRTALLDSATSGVLSGVGAGTPNKLLFVGPITYPVQGLIRAFYDNAGGSAGYLGQPTGAEQSVAGGWTQAFQGGTVYVAPNGGTHSVQGSIGTLYRSSLGAQSGALGWPTGAESAAADGWKQRFERGTIFATASTGAVAVKGSIAASYASGGEESGPFGWPTGGETFAKGAWSQRFQNGVGIVTPSGLARTSPPMYDAYQQAGGAVGRLGLPSADEQAVADGTSQRFAGGSLYLRNGVAFLATGSLGRFYDARGSATGTLGWPVGNERQLSGGWAQDFTGGTVYASGAGTASVSEPVTSAYAAAGGTAGWLGWPRSDAVSVSGSTVQLFSGGSLIVPASGTASFVRGAIGAAYGFAGGAAGTLGLPLDTENGDARGWQQRFSGGSILASGFGTFVVPAPVDASFAAAGGRGGVLGYPVAAATVTGGGISQRFAGGSVFVDSTGITRIVKGAISSLYAAKGAQNWMGWPTGDEQQIPGGWMQQFERGAIYCLNTGTVAVGGAIGSLYSSLGSSTGRLGRPTSGERAVGGGWRQDFQGGSVFASGAGTVWAGGAILQAYDRSGAQAGPLGWPTGSEETVSGGWRQTFQRGAIFASGSGVVPVRGGIGAFYLAAGGQISALGWPVSEERWTGSAWVQQFTKGQIVADGSGTRQVLR